jgi:hypothetical protein
MIVGRVVRNFATHGILSFNTGERVSSVTSPVFALLTGLVASAGVDPLIAAKLLGVAASVITCVLFFSVLRSMLGSYVALAAGAVFTLLPPTIAYAICGLETALYTLVCCLALERLWRRRYRQAFIVAAFSTLVRPDGALVFLVVGLVALWHHRSHPLGILEAALPGILLIAVGLGLHRFYYGTLFPVTVTAKALAYGIDPVRNAEKYLHRMFLAQPGGIPIYGLAIAGIAYAAQRQRSLLVFAAWYAVYHLVFMLRAPLFDWYLQPPLPVLGLFSGLGLVELVHLLTGLLRRPRLLPVAQVAAGSIAIAALSISLVPYAKGRIALQRYEENVRGAAGRWIAANTSLRDTVFTEALGFIGFYNANPFIDWPGLVSPRAVGIISTAAHKDRLSGYRAVIDRLHPTCLVLREEEWQDLAGFLSSGYTIRATFPSRGGARPGYVIATATAGALVRADEVQIRRRAVLSKRSRRVPSLGRLRRVA